MSLSYDQNIFSAFRVLAVTYVDQLEVGKEYYTNYSPESFIISQLLTEKQSRLKWKEFTGVDVGIEDKDDNEIKWIITTDGKQLSLNDSNVGASYNPWLIFTNKTVAQACKETLIIGSHDSWEEW